MPRALGLFARTFFGLNGLLTVWCLGCCGFEPLLNASSRATAAQCAEAATMSSSAEPAITGIPVATAVTTDAPDCGCACQSCCGVSAVSFAFSAGASAPPALPLGLSDSLISISPEPRYPPPKASLLRA